MLLQEAQKNAEVLFSIYAEKGDEDYIGEAISQLEHASQAGDLALQQTGDKVFAIAAFFHDIGHLLPHEDEMDGYGALHHEASGAKLLLDLGFGENIARLIGAHVSTKRYLTFADPEYYSMLSQASKETLVFQGGKMTEFEAERFKRDPLFDLHLLLRRIDEQAKIAHLPPPDIQKWKEMVVEFLVNQPG